MDSKQVTRTVTAAMANRKTDDESAFDAPWIHDRIGFLPPWLMMTEYFVSFDQDRKSVV